MVDIYQGDITLEIDPLKDQTDIGHLTPDGSWIIPSVVEGQKVELDYYVGKKCITCSLPFDAAAYSREDSMLILLHKQPTGDFALRQILCDCVLPRLGMYIS